jgi:PAS domain S-box-containing protein
MLKTRIAVIVVLVGGFIAFHLVEGRLHGGRVPSLMEELLFIGGLVFGVSLLVAGIFRLRLINRVNQVSATAVQILHANNWDQRIEEKNTDLAELSGAVNRLLDVADVSQQELRDSERRLAAQSEALTELTARQTGVSITVADRLRVILETCARTLMVERVSLWRYEDNRQTIRCDDLFERTPARHSSGERLSANDYPAYFNAISHDRIVSAVDAHVDPRTREFGASYLPQHGIGAMLDVPLRQDDRSLGVMCIEHVGGPRHWTFDEQNFAVSLANMVVVSLADADRRQAVQNLAESEARARMVLDSAHDAFIGMDSDGRVVSWNPQAESTFGWDRDEMIGRRLAETIVPDGFRSAHEEGLRRFHETGEAPIVNRRLELRGLHRDGHEFPIEITVTRPVRAGRAYFFGAFVRDISERLKHEEELRTAKEIAEAATRAKSEFLANMSHELRTPLNGVIGYAQLLHRDRTLTATQRDALEAISACGAHLLDLINDVLDLSKIEAGRMEVEPTPCDLRQVAIDLKYVIEERAQRKGLRFTTRISTDVSRRVVLDGRHVRQVLLNLLGNAVKFTPHGEVTLAIGPGDKGRLRFDVIDSGIGIEAENLSVVFQAFRQTRTGAEQGGTGLGLTISHRLVRDMGGELKVESTPGKGSRFYFELPWVEADESVAATTDGDSDALSSDARLAPGHHLTALVADDSSVNRRILASLLESAGVRVITAAGGVEAVELARTHRPDVLLMDLRMDDLSGYEATRRLALEPATASIPVIAVSASAWAEVRESAKEAGCVDFLAKPVKAEVLFAKLQRHTGARFVSPTEEPAAVTRDLPKSITANVATRGLAARIREAATIGNVAALDALAEQLSSGDEGSGVLGRQIATLAAAFDYDALLRLAATLDEQLALSPVEGPAPGHVEGASEPRNA